jgi:hypothetical protein
MEWARVIPRCNFACPKHFEASSNRSGIWTGMNTFKMVCWESDDTALVVEGTGN